MEDGDLSSLIILLLLVILNGFVTLIYTALTNVRQAQMREQAKQIHAMSEDPGIDLGPNSEYEDAGLADRCILRNPR